MKQFEYKRIEYGVSEKKMQEMGSEGWQLVSVTDEYGENGNLHQVMYFMREIEEGT